MSRRARRPTRAVPSRSELLAELASLREQLDELATLRRLQHELDTEREEVAVQREELADSGRKLEASHERYVELFDFAPIAYVTHDGNGVVLEMNLQAASLLGAERARLLDTPLLPHVVPGDRRRFLRHLSRCRSGADPVVTELALDTRARRRVHVLLTSRRIRSVTGRASYSATIMDLSERDLAEADRQRATQERQRIERDQHAAIAASNTVDHFLGVLGHELRTPLTPILLAIETALRRGDVPAHLYPLCEMVRRNVELEARLIDDLLDVTRIRQGRLNLTLVPTDLNDVVDEVCRSIAPMGEAAGLTIDAAERAARSWVFTDAHRVRQVCWNLLQNAIRNTPSGGRIEVGTLNPSPELVTIRVVDTGRGIDAQRMANLFKPFGHDPGVRGGPGLGIGLSISRGLVEAHRGRITATSAGPGQGATFEVELPTIEPRAVTVAAPAPAPRAVGRRLNVLLVEDNDDNAVALADLLELHGFKVERATTVAAALARVPGDFDVVVSDIGLPDGSGLEVAQRLRADGPIKAIALSGYGTARDVQQSLAAGFALHLTKPIDPDRLVSAIRQIAS